MKYLKKTAAGMLIFSVFLIGILTILGTDRLASVYREVDAMEEAVKLPILMYHSVVKDTSKAGEYIIDIQQVKQDILYLKERGYETVSVSDVIQYVNDEGELPEKPVMLTFDDGFYNNYLYVYPVLQETGSCAVISIVGAFSEEFSKSGQKNEYGSYLTYDMMREMEASGLVEIGNHSYDFHSLDKRKGCLRKRGENAEVYKSIFINDTMKVQELLLQNGVTTPRFYTYPFGILNGETEEYLAELGFECTLGCQEGINYITKNPDCLYQLKRYNRGYGTSSEEWVGAVLRKME